MGNKNLDRPSQPDLVVHLPSPHGQQTPKKTKKPLNIGLFNTKINSSPRKYPNESNSTDEPTVTSIIEDIVRLSPFKSSKQKRTTPLKMIRDSTQDVVSLFTVDHFEDLILNIIKSPKGRYFPQCPEKVPYLYDAFLRVTQTQANHLISSFNLQEFMKIILSQFITLVIVPESFGISSPIEDDNSPLDIKCPIKSEFYELLKAGIDRTFLECLLDELTEEEYALIFQPVFKRMLQDTSRADIFQNEEMIKALELLKFLVTFDDRLLRCFYRSSMFIPKETKAFGRRAVQMASIFGSALSLTALPNNASNMANRHKLPKTTKNVVVAQQKIKEIITIVEDIIGYIAQREEQGYQAVIAWIYTILEANDIKNRSLSAEEKGCSEGFLVHFLTLLLKLSRPYLNEIKEAAHLADIDSMYLREKKIFDNLPLLNGNSNFYFPSIIEAPKEIFHKSPIMPTNAHQEIMYQQVFGKIQGDDHLVSEEDEDSLRSSLKSSSLYGDEEDEEDEDEEEEKHRNSSKNKSKGHVSSKSYSKYGGGSCDNTYNIQEDASFHRDQIKQQKVQMGYSSPWKDDSITEEADHPLDMNEFKLAINPDRFVMEDDFEKSRALSQNKESSIKLSKDEELILSTTTFPSKNTHEGLENDPIPHFNFLTEIVFVTNHVLRITHPQFDEYSKLSQEISKASLGNQVSKQYSMKYAYDVHYSDPELWDNLTRFLTLNALYIPYNRGVPLKSLVNCSEIFESYLTTPIKDAETAGMIPTYWMENIVQYLQILLETSPYLIIKTPQPVRILTNFMLVAMSDKAWINNPHLKAEYLRFFNSLFPAIADEGFGVNQIDSRVSSIILKENSFFEEQVVDSLLSFFWQLEKTNSTNEFEKYNYRHSFCKLLNQLAGNGSGIYASSKVKLGLEVFMKDQNRFQKFFCVLLNDMMTLLDDSVSKMQAIKKFDDLVHGPGINALLPDERVEQEFLCQQNRYAVYAGSKYLSQYYEFVYTLMLVNNKCILADEQLLEKFTTSLNYTMAQLLESTKEALTLDEMHEMNFYGTEIFYFVVLSLYSFQSESCFIKLIVADERSFSLEYYREAFLILTEETLLNVEEIEGFKHLMKTMEAFSEEKKEEDEFVKYLGDSVPDEFIDPIMGHIMKQPVLLLTSNVIVDYSTIMRHLMTEATDPFNRKELHKGLVVAQVEMQEKLQYFLNGKRKIWNEEKEKKSMVQ